VARAGDRGPLASTRVIYAELCLGFESSADLASVLSDAGVRRLPLHTTPPGLHRRRSRRIAKRGGKRTAPLPDSSLGAHALVEKLPLLTRDAKRYRTYFPGCG